MVSDKEEAQLTCYLLRKLNPIPFSSISFVHTTNTTFTTTTKVKIEVTIIMITRSSKNECSTGLKQSSSFKINDHQENKIKSS